MRDRTINHRFSRQTRLTEIGVTGQRKIARARVLIIGMGGLGSPASIYLTSSGIGNLGIVDFDTVNAHNLPRQILYKEADLHRKKALVAATRLQKLSRKTKIRTYDKKLAAGNIASVFKDYDVVLDCTDNFESKFLVADACRKLRKTLVFASMSKFEAQLGVFHPKKGACFRCLYADIPITAIPNCEDAGVLGAFAGIVGCTQAMLALQSIVSNPNWPVPYGTLHVLNGKSYGIKQFKIHKKPTCICSKKNLRLPAREETEIEFAELAQLMKKDTTRLIDVREPTEVRRGMLRFSKNFPFSKIEKGFFPKIPKNTETIVLYCAAGLRSKKACALLKSKLKNLTLLSLRGGFSARVAAKRMPL